MDNYAHIGIGKHIFLHSHNNEDVIGGNIKMSPPDFQVDEVLEFHDDKRRIPGMALEGKISAKDFVAHSRKHPPVQDDNEERMAHKSTGDESHEPPRTKEEETDQALSLTELIRGFDAQIVPSLQFLRQLARDRLLVQKTTDLDDDSATKVVLHPRDTSTPWTRNDRTRIHEYFKHQFPLLQADRNIHVGIDRDWDALLPFLEHPHPDQMEALLKFVKAPPPPPPPFNRRSSKKRRRANGRFVDDNQSPFGSCCSLTVKHGLSKEERKHMHALLSDLSYKRLNSRTITTKDDNGDAKTVIQVAWSQHALRQQESKHNKRGSNNQHCLCVLRKTGLEHLQAIRTLTRVLDGVDASSDIGTAGIKDRQAVTHQFVTFRNVSSPRVVQEAATRLDERRLQLFGFYKVDWLLNQGDLVGNNFSIVLRDVYVQKEDGTKHHCCHDLLQSRVQSLSKHGFVNYFGEQRFGVCTATSPMGSRSFDIGRAMWQGDYARAIDGILQGSRPSIYKIWNQSKGDPTATLRAEKNWQAMPRERAILKGLQKYGNEHPKKALECVPYGARMLWMHAYQSLVWNKAATERIETYGTKVVLGDLFRADGQTVQIVTKDNLSTVQWNQLVLPMPGSGIQYPTNDIGGFYISLLKQDGISMTNNNNDSMSSSAKGCYRNLVVYPTDLVCETSQLEDSKFVTLTFGLPKGSYATMMLREFQRKS